MNLDNLTLGDLKEVKVLFGGSAATVPPAHPWVGRYVVVRSHMLGVWGGVELDIMVITKDQVSATSGYGCGAGNGVA